MYLFLSHASDTQVMSYHDMCSCNPAVIVSRVHFYMWELKRTGAMIKSLYIEQRVYTWVVYAFQIYHSETHVQKTILELLLYSVIRMGNCCHKWYGRCKLSGLCAQYLVSPKCHGGEIDPIGILKGVPVYQDRPLLPVFSPIHLT